MNKKIAQLLISWIAVVTASLLYQSNIFPEAHLKEIADRAWELQEALSEVK